MFQLQVINHHGSFINYGQPRTPEQVQRYRNDKQERGSMAVEGQHFRFIQVS